VDWLLAKWSTEAEVVQRRRSTQGGLACRAEEIWPGMDSGCGKWLAHEETKTAAWPVGRVSLGVVGARRGDWRRKSQSGCRVGAGWGKKSWGRCGTGREIEIGCAQTVFLRDGTLVVIMLKFEGKSTYRFDSSRQKLGKLPPTSFSQYT
jgi:hypothetical protein